MTTQTEADYVYENAPLVEVIAELRWSLIPLSAIPGGSVDPAFAHGSDAFTKLAKDLGYDKVEHLVPDGIPLEMLGGRPTLRFRKQINEWPLYQIGPGLFTCNIVPPYGGWKNFRETLRDGLTALFKAVPLDSTLVKPESLELRYIDAFTADHGLNGYEKFVRENLGINISVPVDLLESLEINESATTSSMEVRIPKGASNVVIKIAPGTKDGTAAAIAEFSVILKNSDMPDTAAGMADWMDTAHNTLHNVFDKITSEQLKDRMRPRHPTQGD